MFTTATARAGKRRRKLHLQAAMGFGRDADHQGVAQPPDPQRQAEGGPVAQAPPQVVAAAQAFGGGAVLAVLQFGGQGLRRRQVLQRQLDASFHRLEIAARPVAVSSQVASVAPESTAPAKRSPLPGGSIPSSADSAA